MEKLFSKKLLFIMFIINIYFSHVEGSNPNNIGMSAGEYNLIAIAYLIGYIICNTIEEVKKG